MDEDFEKKGFKKMTYYPLDLFYRVFVLKELPDHKRLFVAHVIVPETVKITYLKYTFASMDAIAKEIIAEYKEKSEDIILHYIYELKGGIKFRVDRQIYDTTMQKEEEIKSKYELKIGACALVVDDKLDNFKESFETLNGLINADKKLNTLLTTTYDEAVKLLSNEY
jgi:hypothetical protein